MPDCKLTYAGYGDFHRTRSRFIEALWIFTEWLVVTNPLQPSSRIRAAVLRLFGARIGHDVIIRPRVRVKFPWQIAIGDNCWIGEGVWIHNQAQVTIEHDSVISQETFISTGSHAHRTDMHLIVEPVTIGSGVWLTARCIITLGVSIVDDVVITPGSVVHKSITRPGIYGGNPLQPISQDQSI